MRKRLAIGGLFTIVALLLLLLFRRQPDPRFTVAIVGVRPRIGPGAKLAVHAQVTPNTVKDLTYAWTASGGLLSANAANAVVTASSDMSSITIKVTATSPSGKTATASAVVEVADYRTPLPDNPYDSVQSELFPGGYEIRDIKLE